MINTDPIPNDIRAKAVKFNQRLDEIFEHWPLMHNPTVQDIFAQALMQEREAERERCAKIAQTYNWFAGTAIRSPDKTP